MLDLKEYYYMAPVLCFDMEQWADTVKNHDLATFKAGEIIRMQGSDEGDVFIAESGYFIVTCVLGDGTETVQHLGGRGCAFGYVSADTGQPYMSSAMAMTECSGYFIPRGAVARYKEEDPSFLYKLLLQENEKCYLYFNRIILLAVPQTKFQLLTLFLGFCARIGVEKPDGCLIPLELTHQLISEIIHVNRVTVSRFISLYQKKGCLVKEDKYFKVNVEKIAEIL